MPMKTYSELIFLKTFDERFNYLKTDSIIGDTTFGSQRYYNQKFYNSPEWKRLRREIIIRDNGCEMGLDGYEIESDLIYIHHIEPITINDIINKTFKLIDPDNLITVSSKLHNAIHYGGEYDIAINLPVNRKPNDTCPWK